MLSAGLFDKRVLPHPDRSRRLCSTHVHPPSPIADETLEQPPPITLLAPRQRCHRRSRRRYPTLCITRLLRAGPLHPISSVVAETQVAGHQRNSAQVPGSTLLDPASAEAVNKTSPLDAIEIQNLPSDNQDLPSSPFCSVSSELSSVCQQYQCLSHPPTLAHLPQSD